MELMMFSEQMAAKSKEQIETEVFTMVSFQFAVVDRGEYYPCELGVVQFSLTGGVKDAYHTFISPKPLPPGSYAEAKHHAEETHQIPFLAEFPYWNENLQLIAEKLRSMIGDSDRVFAKGSGDELKVATGCLEFLVKRSHTYLSLVSVLPVEQLIECIFKRFGACCSMGDDPSKYLQRTAHDFDPNIRCFYHEKELDSLHCAYGTVFRLFFNLMDFMKDKNIVFVHPMTMRVPDHLVSRYERPRYTNFNQNGAGIQVATGCTWEYQGDQNMQAEASRSSGHRDGVVMFSGANFQEMTTEDDQGSDMDDLGTINGEEDGNFEGSDTGTIVSPLEYPRRQLFQVDPLPEEFIDDGPGTATGYNGDWDVSRLMDGDVAVEVLEMAPLVPPQPPVPKTVCGITVEPTPGNHPFHKRHGNQ